VTEAELVRKTLASSTEEFVGMVAAGTPTPGGGSVAAHAGQLGAALGIMMCNLTAGKPKFIAVEPRILEIRGRLEDLSKQLGRLIDRDADSFQQVMAAYKLPKNSEQEAAERSRQVAIALLQATVVPFDTVKSSFEVIRLLDELASIGNPNALSDVASAAQIAGAAMKAAYYNVAVNVGSLSESGEAREMGASAKEMIAQASIITGRIEEAFLKKMGAG